MHSYAGAWERESNVVSSGSARGSKGFVQLKL